MSYSYDTTGRSGSQSSIYDYPEHLNPFYEDENHKRLRFWNFRSLKPKSERRGSLSSIRDGLRDMWEFKTFRVKKKRASSLGVTKTSESPPPLRRNEHDLHYNTISNASAYRNTINTVGHNPRYTQSNTTTPLFQRNSCYRSSLQDQSRNNGIGLYRNDRYRSTIQNGYATYSGNGMVTSTPRSRYDNVATSGRGMTAGVSQSSLKSTNPFEEDDLDDSVSLAESCISAGGTVRQSMTRPRKKRRAPAPPPRSVNTSRDSSDASLLATRLTIEETAPSESLENIRDLTNLTAEIESFVRTTSDDESNKPSPEKVDHSNNDETSSDSNNNNVTERIISTTTHETTEIKQLTSENNHDRINREVACEESSNASVPISATAAPIDIPEPVEEISQIEVLKIVEETKHSTPPQPPPRARVPPPPIPQTPPLLSEELDFENLSLPETPVPARRQNRNRYPNTENGDILRITESSDSVTTITPEEEENMESKVIKHVNYEFEYKVEPIKTKISEKIDTARMKISESSGDISSLPNAGTERRRSVRDIIESINKSQSLLKGNYESTGTLYSAQSSDSVNRSIRELNEREKEIQRMLREMDANLNDEPVPELPQPVQPTKKRGSYYDNVPETDENMDNLEDRNNLLSKSEMRSKKSPTKSLGIEPNEEVQFQDCIDWNPLPKPRRSRHFPEPVSQTSSATTGSVLTAVNHNNNVNNES
ncbi:uncharacterized protein LOC129775712 [Toxorhynchites rutilus septentrionalis]|uniref:uncharacterized protein LOC129775712 n=1 Tax=Toxorhynchites rutilus septentrionalis TaxID=329112 RepID=UPI002478796D|nr:uncharacterized protein LOC129775712 [Toxorhynchites rutilus septentrionalis]XP_055636720.1 uncharacterized protein LOC129775712 [Toxorhynchites rutilus septentrionalis]XP_055636721.1 uncharacterized protein LOC129775712 [Toxorhynchites rutilus septentrionalis]XP_055636722.1 uncharacterized protein LOC129775712 [Toxorhynchites rutilus septentrionalis]XP_055636723.1 uncharacterized protein LOC129775712 [Toxorhynchites rutilus septentrionalis]XP_055636724.1 uncharacterized protein LOC12977571